MSAGQEGYVKKQQEPEVRDTLTRGNLKLTVEITLLSHYTCVATIPTIQLLREGKMRERGVERGGGKYRMWVPGNTVFFKTYVNYNIGFVW